MTKNELAYIYPGLKERQQLDVRLGKIKNDKDLAKKIIEVVYNDYETPVHFAKLKNRTIEVKTPRQVAVYLIAKLTKLKHHEISVFFNQDRTTVIHSVHAIENEIETNRNFKNRIKKIKSIISE